MQRSFATTCLEPLSESWSGSSRQSRRSSLRSAIGTAENTLLCLATISPYVKQCKKLRNTSLRTVCGRHYARCYRHAHIVQINIYENGLKHNSTVKTSTPQPTFSFPNSLFGPTDNSHFHLTASWITFTLFPPFDHHYQRPCNTYHTTNPFRRKTHKGPSHSTRHRAGLYKKNLEYNSITYSLHYASKHYASNRRTLQATTSNTLLSSSRPHFQRSLYFLVL